MNSEYKRLGQVALFVVPRLICAFLFCVPLWIVGWIYGFAVEELETGVFYGKRHNEAFWQDTAGYTKMPNGKVE